MDVSETGYMAIPLFEQQEYGTYNPRTYHVAQYIPGVVSLQEK